MTKLTYGNEVKLTCIFIYQMNNQQLVSLSVSFNILYINIYFLLNVILFFLTLPKSSCAESEKLFSNPSLLGPSSTLHVRTECVKRCIHLNGKFNWISEWESYTELPEFDHSMHTFEWGSTFPNVNSKSQNVPNCTLTLQP